MNASVNNFPQKRQMSSSGFTLIELMVTIAVLAIIVSIAAPNISTQLANQRVKSTAATFANALKEAKIESFLRRQVLSVSYNNNGTAAGIINIIDQNAKVIATYKYDAKSTIKSTVSVIKFKPSKTADEMTYTICDSNILGAARQVIVSTVANVSSKLGGTCP